MAGGDRVGAGALGDHADGPADPVGVAQHVVARDGGRAGVGAGQGGEDLDGGGLAAPFGPSRPKTLPRSTTTSMPSRAVTSPP